MAAAAARKRKEQQQQFSSSSDDSDDDDELLLAAANAWAKASSSSCTNGGDNKAGGNKADRTTPCKANSKKRPLEALVATSNEKQQNLYQQQQPIHQPSSSKQQSHSSSPFSRLPLPFPAHLQPQLPTGGGFLRNEAPYEHAFAVALQTAYEGCVWDSPSTLAGRGRGGGGGGKLNNNDNNNCGGGSNSANNHGEAATKSSAKAVAVNEREVQAAFRTLDQEGLFRTDITQPAGLGGKCVKTMVTRCLLGDPGTTYKYLGLRMFAHPWCEGKNEEEISQKQQQQQQLQPSVKKSKPPSSPIKDAAIRSIYDLNRAVSPWDPRRGASREAPRTSTRC